MIKTVLLTLLFLAIIGAVGRKIKKKLDKKKAAKVTPPPRAEKIVEPKPRPTPKPKKTIYVAPDRVPSGQSEFSLDKVKWLHTDVSAWTETSVIKNINITPKQISIPHSKSTWWRADPATRKKILLAGNPWVFIEVGGQWCAGTWEWLRYKQTSKNLHLSQLASHIKRPPLDKWQPVEGDIIYMMVSTLARGGERTHNERSNVVRVEITKEMLW